MTNVRDLIEPWVLEIRRLERSLNRIIGMAGSPDAAEACRNIIKEAKRVLATYPKQIEKCPACGTECVHTGTE